METWSTERVVPTLASASESQVMAMFEVLFGILSLEIWLGDEENLSKSCWCSLNDGVGQNSWGYEEDRGGGGGKATVHATHFSLELMCHAENVHHACRLHALKRLILSL